MVKKLEIAVQPDADYSSIAELETGLRIDEHALDEALIQQPDFFYRVSKQLALVVSRRDAKKQELSEEEAKADGETRDVASKRKEKVTEAEIKNMVRLDPNVVKATSELLGLGRLVGQLSALKEAFQQRSYVLKDLSLLYVSGYYGSNQDGSSRRPTASSVRGAQATQTREVLRNRREHYARGDDRD